MGNATERMHYWHAMAYGALPSFAIRDTDTLDAFTKTSPWAISETDNPMSPNVHDVEAEGEIEVDKENLGT